MKLQQAEERREREKGREPVKSVQCVNPSCRDIGHSDTSYLCRSCYSLQVNIQSVHIILDYPQSLMPKYAHNIRNIDHFLHFIFISFIKFSK